MDVGDNERPGSRSERSRLLQVTQVELPSRPSGEGPRKLEIKIFEQLEDEEELKQWATCISVLYEGIIYLSFMTQPMTVLRGVNESTMELPPEFTDASQGQSQGFAGGVEMVRA